MRKQVAYEVTSQSYSPGRLLLPVRLMYKLICCVLKYSVMSQPIRVYVDTCVFGGTLDIEFALATARFFDMVREGRFHLVISSLVVSEMSEAPHQVQKLFNDCRDT